MSDTAETSGPRPGGARARDRRASAVAELGRQALVGPTGAELMNEAAERVLRVLGVAYCGVFEILPSGEALLLRAGAGWREGFVGRATLGAGSGRSARARLSDGPVAVGDAGEEDRFREEPLLRDHGVQSGVSVVIHGRERPFGVLGAYAGGPRSFGGEDLDFLRSVANVLGAAVERERAEGRSRFTSRAVDSSRNGVLITDPNLPDDPIVYANPAFERMTGYSAAEAIGRNCRFLQGEDRYQPPLRGLRAALREGREWRGVLLNHKKDGTPFWNELSVSAVRDEEGRVTNFVGVQDDVTRRVRAEEKLRDSQERFRALASATFEGVAVHEKGVIIEANEALAEMFGYEPPEVIGKSALELTAPESRELIRKNIARGYEEPYEAVGLRKDGTRFEVELRGKPFEYKGGAVRATAIRDITEHKRNEAALREAEEKYRSIFENSAEGIFRSTPEGRIFTANPALARLTGYASPGEMISAVTNVGDQLYEDPRRREEFVRVLERHGSVSGFESRIRRRDGSVRWVSTSARAVRGEGGRVLFLEGTVEDITERKEAERELWEAEQRFRRLATQAPVGIFETDPEGRCVFVNERWRQIAGLSPEEAAGDGWVRALHPEDRERVAAEWYSAAGSGRAFSMEYRFRTPQGEVTWVSGAAAALRDPDGEVTGHLGTVTDITERKRAEAELRERTDELEKMNRVGRLLSSELDLRRVLQAVTDEATELTGARFGAFFYDVADGSAEPSLYTVSGIPREAFPTPRDTGVFGPVLRGEGVVRFDDVRRAPGFDGTPFHHAMPEAPPVVSYLAAPVTGRAGEVLGGLFFGHPQEGVFGGREERIAEAIAAQAAVAIDNARLFESVQQSEERYRALYEDNPSMYFTLDEEGTVLSVNRFGAEQLGYAPGELVGRPILGIVHEEDKEAAARSLSRCLRDPGRVDRWELRKVRKDGGLMWVEEAARAVRNPNDGRAILVSCEDVTERRRVEEALLEIREGERRRIARDLHDVGLQDLATALQAVQAARLVPGAPLDDLGKAADALRRATRGLRDVVHDLRLEQGQPFVRTVESLVELNRQLTPEREVSLEVGGGFPLELPGKVGVELLRLIQEALANARRHSNARRVAVVLGVRRDEVGIEIIDDGDGFDPGAVSQKPGVGLVGMGERARSLGGKLEVRSAPSEGTRVRARVPVGLLKGDRG